MLCVCVGYSLHPQVSDFANQSSLEAYYHRAKAEHLQIKMATIAHSNPVPLTPGRHDPGPPPPPPDLQPIIDKTAEYVARNSEDFERTVLERHCGDPKFGFLNPWNEYYPYYKFRLQLNKEKVVAMEREVQRREEKQRRGKKVQKLSQGGSVCFKLQPKNKAVLETLVGPVVEEEEDEEDEEGEADPVAVQGEKEGASQPGVGGWQDGREVASGYQEEPIETDLHEYHYSAEGLVYNGNGDVCEQDGERDTESPPAAKRSKKSDESTVVMDNKVQVGGSIALFYVEDMPFLYFRSF